MRRLVEQDHLRVGHQRAADGAHLLLAAGGVAGLRWCGAAFRRGK
jgi:hypothetical protein